MHLLLRRCVVVVALLSGGACAAQARHTAPARQSPQPTGPIAVFDTTLGRITCRLYDKQAPVTTANFIALAQGKKTWRDHLFLTDVHDKPFYDGTALAGIVDGIRGGDRFGGGEGAAGAPISRETIPGIAFDRPGRLAMAVHAGEISSSFFLISLHADAEFDEAKRGAIFGQCDDAGVQVAAAISHQLLSVDNRTDKAVAINRLLIVQPGDPLPPIAPDVPPASIVPQPVPPTLPTLAPPEPTGPGVTIDTTAGSFSCRLFSQQAPVAVTTFTQMAEGTRAWTNPNTHVTRRGKHYYEGLHFNRVLPDFMIQNQDYPDDAGDAGFHYDIEPVPGLTFDRAGRMAMANSGPTTNDTSFFITLQPTHALDNRFTIFGQCDDASVKLADSLAHVPRDAHNRPLTPITIRSVTINR